MKADAKNEVYRPGGDFKRHFQQNFPSVEILKNSTANKSFLKPDDELPVRISKVFNYRRTIVFLNLASRTSSSNAAMPSCDSGTTPAPWSTATLASELRPNLRMQTTRIIPLAQTTRN